MAADDKWIRVTGRYAMLVQGVIKIEDLDDDELARGQLKDKNGQFRGRPPAVIPKEMVQAMRREWLGRAEAKLREALMGPGIGTLVELARDPSVDQAVRLRASQTIIDRMMGKVPDKIEFRAEDPVEALFRSLLSDPRGLTAPKEFSAEERELLS
jgi:hypothetical protein